MNKTFNILKGLFCFLLVLVFSLFVLGQIFLPKDMSDDSQCEQFDVPWKMINSDGSTTDIRIPGKYELARNEKMIVETVLPKDIKENLYLCFRSNRQDVEIYVDGELRERYSTETSRVFGQSSPGAFVFMRIKDGDAGKTIRVSYKTDTAYSGNLQEIYYGDKMGIWEFMFNERGDEFILAIFMLLLGIISIIASLMVRFYYHKSVELGYLGCGVTFAACWMISDSVFRQIIFPNVSIVNDLAFVMVMMLPFPFMIYMNEVQKRRYNPAYIVVCSMVALDIIVFNTLQFLNILDYADSISIFSLFCGAAVLLIIITLIADCIRGNIRQYKLEAIGVLGASVAAVLQLLLYFARIAYSSGMAIASGMIVLLVISSINTVHNILNIEKEKQQAIYANEAKAKFLANMSHEIRTPINAVLGMDEMIIEESTEEKIKEYAIDIKNAGKTILSLINDILDFSKIESGKIEIIPVEYDLASLISDSYNMINMKAKDKGLKFRIENDTRLPRRLYGDEVRVRQVLVNLLTNAVKYTKEGSIVMSVQGKRMDDGRLSLNISVEDTGIGITEENRAKLFESFQRVDEKRNRNIEGTGLGLAITMQIMKMMQGSINVESEYGKGSVFSVEFPQGIVDDSQVGNLSEYMKSVKREETKDKDMLLAPEGKILVVDDADLNLKVFCGVLRHTQLQIDTASSGSEALEMICKKEYHIIFLDHMMPDMDGIETLHAMKQRKSEVNADTPVIMLTANAIEGMREMYLEEGFADYLSKPIQIDELKDIIRKYLPDELILTNEDAANYEAEENEDEDEVSVLDKLKKLAFLDVNTGIRYCSNDEEFYLEMLGEYVEGDKTNLLKECYTGQDWEQYSIYIHSLKSTSLTIGADKLSEHAKEIETAIKEGRTDYVLREHEALMKEYNEVLQKIERVISKS